MPRIKILKVLNKQETSKNGKQYIKCSVKTVDKNGQEVWINGFGNDTTMDWREGNEIDLDIYQEEYNGKMYLKFKEVAQRSVFVELDKINAKLDMLMGKKPVSATEELGLTTEPAADEPPEFHKPDDVKVEDIPF